MKEKRNLNWRQLRLSRLEQVHQEDFLIITTSGRQPRKLAIRVAYVVRALNASDIGASQIFEGDGLNLILLNGRSLPIIECPNLFGTSSESEHTNIIILHVLGRHIALRVPHIEAVQPLSWQAIYPIENRYEAFLHLQYQRDQELIFILDCQHLVVNHLNIQIPSLEAPLDLQTMKLAVVDDNPTVSALTSKALRRITPQITLYHSIETLNRGPNSSLHAFDVILFDSEDVSRRIPQWETIAEGALRSDHTLLVHFASVCEERYLQMWQRKSMIPVIGKFHFKELLNLVSRHSHKWAS